MRDPQTGETVYLIDEDGHITRETVAVRTVVSRTADLRTFEIIDNYNKTRYVKAHPRPPTWREVFI